MKKYLGMLILCIIGISSVSAAELTATIAEIAGKVECKLPQKEWQPAKIGDVLPAGSLISTGFKSTAILKTESATLTVKPVTRLSLDDLVKSEGTTKTQMFLMAGRVKAEVTPKTGEKADFKIKSPTATASVRGTGFEFDGKNLLVDHGAVQFETDAGVGVAQVVSAGELSSVTSLGSVSVPVAVAPGGLAANAVMSAAASFSFNSNESAGAALSIDEVYQPELQPKTGDINIKVEWE
ncbi:MAG: FecR family protein [Treponema sp.]|uniref:FecR family protein n=1 Tax=Treponema sp. TaxID=166 RepID=UPI003FA1BD70